MLKQEWAWLGLTLAFVFGTNGGLLRLSANLQAVQTSAPQQAAEKPHEDDLWKRDPQARQRDFQKYILSHRAIVRLQKDWTQAVTDLGNSGDAFTLYLLKRMDRKSLSAAEDEIRTRAIQRI